MADYDAIVVGGGPAGATAATDLAEAGWRVMLLDRAGRIKPCGGAIPPRLVRDFAVPDELITARINEARMVAPSGKTVAMPVEGGFVGMVDRDAFDEWLRVRAAGAGATRATGRFVGLERTGADATIRYEDADGVSHAASARIVIGADGANSAVARAALPRETTKHVFAYHEIVASPEAGSADHVATRCDVVYRGALSPDFYAWVFPHGATTSIGVGSAHKGFALRPAVERLRRESGLDGCATIRSEGAPIPLKPRRRWDDGRNVVLAGDAAGVVAPASGEGIYYAMASARMVATAAIKALETNDGRALAGARTAFMAEHGRVFMILGWLQALWYRNDWLRERFVSMCRDPDVQRLTWESYMNKALVKRQPRAHLRLAVANLRTAIASRWSEMTRRGGQYQT